MEIFRDETEFPDIRVVHRVVDMFERRPDIQRIVRMGLFGMDYGDELHVADEDDYEYDSWVCGHSNSHGCSRLSDGSSDRGLSGNCTKSSGSGYYYTCDLPRPPSVKVQEEESDTEKRTRLLREPKKYKGKAEKKRLKKQKRKEKKRLEQEKKDKKNEEEKDDAQESKDEDSKPVNDKSQLASAKATDSSEDESSDEDSDTRVDSGASEELDMTSTFVSKAALIARRKVEQNPRPEKKKSPVKEEPKTVPDKPNEDPEVEKNSAGSFSPTLEDYVKISTDLANIGNRFASAGDFKMAVQYFTNAIKYNPREFKLFGNRSFCFEKMNEYEKALTDAELSLNMCPHWVKGLFRKGRALAGLKRYEQAAQAFREVLKLDGSCAEAAQELMRVQITQLMAYGFTREQSSNALIIHGTVKQALEVLSNLHRRPGAIQKAALPLAQVANVTGVSPVLSANTNPVPASPQSRDAPKTAVNNKPLGAVQNMSNVQSRPKPGPNQATKTNNKYNHPPRELFPVWVGNLVYPVNDYMIIQMFKRIGDVHSVKVLTAKRCAFVNYTTQEFCDEAIRRFHGSELNGVNIVVRYPDRIPQGMGISKSALKAHDLQDENVGQNEYVDGRRRSYKGGYNP